MDTLAIVLVGFVAIEHIYIMLLEMFLWTKPRTRKIFGMNAELAEKTKAMAANQGLYNGFLAAGLIWSLVSNNIAIGLYLQFFFLSCVIIAAIFGGVTVKKSILYIQGAPAIFALLVLIIS